MILLGTQLRLGRGNVFRHRPAKIPSSVKYYVLHVICINLPSQVPNKVYKVGFLLAGADIQCKSNI